MSANVSILVTTSEMLNWLLLLFSKVESLPLVATPLFQVQCSLAPLCCRPCSWPKLGEPLHQAECIGANHRNAQSPPNFPHHLAKLSWPRLPPLGSVHSCYPRLGKHKEKFVKVRGGRALSLP